MELEAPETDPHREIDIIDNSDRRQIWKWFSFKNFIPSKVNGSQEPQPATTVMGSSTIKPSVKLHIIISLLNLTPLTLTSLGYKYYHRKDPFSTDLLSLFDKLLVFTCVLYAVMLIEAERRKCRLRNKTKPDSKVPLFVGQLPDYKQDEKWVYDNSIMSFMGICIFAEKLMEINDFGEIWKDLTFYCGTSIFLGIAKLRLYDFYLHFRINKDAVLEIINVNEISVKELTRQKQKLACTWNLWNFAILMVWVLTAILYVTLLYTNKSMHSLLNFQLWEIHISSHYIIFAKSADRLQDGVASCCIFLYINMFIGFSEAIVLLSYLHKREYNINRLYGTVKNKSTIFQI